MSELDDLTRKLKSLDPHVRASAAFKLGEIKDERAVPALINVLKDKIANVSWNATWALGNIGQPAISALIRALKHENLNMRTNAANALERIEKKNPGLVRLEDVQESLLDFIELSQNTLSAQNEAGHYYFQISEAVRQGRGKINMPGELSPGKPKPPKRMFRESRAVCAN